MGGKHSVFHTISLISGNIPEGQRNRYETDINDLTTILNMNIYPLVFSNNSRYRITRHVLFWTIWIFYYTYFVTISWSKIPFHKAFFAALFEQVISTPIDMAFCYSIIYFLIPRYLMRGKYIQMVLLWLLLSVAFIACFRFYSTDIVPFFRSFDGLPAKTIHSSYSFTWAFFDLFSQINMEGCIAASIKLGKMWYIKQEELSLLKAEKLKILPEVENGQLQPIFLVNALDRVELLANEKPAVVRDMIKKIKNLLLYVMYDNNQSKISLEKEIKILEEYVELEKLSSSDRLNIVMKINGNISGERIAPFIILSLVENSFRQLSLIDLPEKCITMELQITEGHLKMLIAWSKPVDTSTLVNGGNAFLQNIGKRLNLLYPHSHELKVVIKTNQFIIDLKIDLHEAVN